MTRNEIQRRYRLKHYDNIRKKRLAYYQKNIEKFRLEGRKRYANPKNKIREKASKNEYKRITTWKEILPKNPKCEICGKKLIFNSGNQSDSPIFDHKHGGREPIKRKPSNWLRSSVRTPEKEKIWNDCKFGVLCRKCNLYLPTNTNKRNALAKSIVRYVFGENVVIINEKEYKRRKIAKK